MVKAEEKKWWLEWNIFASSLYMKQDKKCLTKKETLYKTSSFTFWQLLAILSSIAPTDISHTRIFFWFTVATHTQNKKSFTLVSFFIQRNKYFLLCTIYIFNWRTGHTNHFLFYQQRTNTRTRVTLEFFFFRNALKSWKYILIYK